MMELVANLSDHGGTTTISNKEQNKSKEHRNKEQRNKEQRNKEQRTKE
jgi:hypothetical protein